MSSDAHIEDRLGELLLGDVDDAERERMEAHAAVCASCGQALAAATESFALVGAALPPESPCPSVRARVLDEIAPKPMAPFVDKLAALFDVTRTKARALIDRLDAPEAWSPGPVPGSWVMMVNDPGPQLTGAFCGFVKMAPSVSWPRHTHLGTEHMLVLAGGFRQTGDGHEVHPGMTHTMTEGSTHGFVVFEDEGCISAAVVWGGVRFEDPGFTLGDLSK